ncbi:unnamed protein product, partial [Mesorhabditis belari]|uniref:Uncharacterized protein n=1 Tax=Mesorhabditis belari TaxID=2138241 RepID=A0AAF3J3X8_9BILA
MQASCVVDRYFQRHLVPAMRDTFGMSKENVRKFRQSYYKIVSRYHNDLNACVWAALGNDGYTQSYQPWMASRDTIMVQILTESAVLVKAGCEHLVYQGGYPAAAGANRYLIHTFNSANTGPASSLSFIPSYSATISVPPNCPISIDAADYSKDYSGKHGVLMNVVPRNGFVMSRDYPNSMIGSGNGGMNVNLQYALNSSVFANQSVYFNILVDQFFDGQAGTPQLKLSFDNQVGYILNKTTTGFSQNRNASSFRVEFTTSNTTGANFLLHFSTSTTSTTDSPTRTTTRTTKKSQIKQPCNQMRFKSLISTKTH